jgi:hypothetical protein
VFANRVLRRIFGPKRDEVTGGWRKHNEEIHNLYSSPSIITIIKSRRMMWAGHAARMGRIGMHIRVGFWREIQKRPLGRPRRRWVDSVKIALDWNDTDQWRAHVNMVMNLRVPKNAGKFLSSFTNGGFSKRAQLHE